MLRTATVALSLVVALVAGGAVVLAGTADLPQGGTPAGQSKPGCRTATNSRCPQPADCRSCPKKMATSAKGCQKCPKAAVKPAKYCQQCPTGAGVKGEAASGPATCPLTKN